MLHGKHSAILLTFIKIPFVIKIFILSIFEWPFYTCFAVYNFCLLMYTMYTKEEKKSPQIEFKFSA